MSLDDPIPETCEFLGSACPGAGTFNPAEHLRSVAGKGLAESSSIGPMIDGRVKPDVIAPGNWVVSAGINAAGSTCRIKALTGTSMATPITASTMTMFYEWMADGFYPDGVQGGDPAPHFGPLAKAAAINSARTFDVADGKNLGDCYTYEDGEGLSDSYNGATGYGFIGMSRVMFFGDSPFTSVFWYPGAPKHPDASVPSSSAVETGDSESFDVVAEAGTNVQVTLCWYDPAPAETLPAVALVNNLDLILEDADGKVICNGNERSVYIPEGGSAPSNVDSCEKCEISIEAAEGFFASSSAKVTVRVVGESVPSGPQEFAVVTTFTPGTSDDGVNILVYAAVAGAALILVGGAALFFVSRSSSSSPKSSSGRADVKPSYADPVIGGSEIVALKGRAGSGTSRSKGSKVSKASKGSRGKDSKGSRARSGSNGSNGGRGRSASKSSKGGRGRSASKSSKGGRGRSNTQGKRKRSVDSKRGGGRSRAQTSRF